MTEGQTNGKVPNASQRIADEIKTACPCLHHSVLRLSPVLFALLSEFHSAVHKGGISFAAVNDTAARSRKKDPWATLSHMPLICFHGA